jgi:PAS domain S-box-containing protein
LDELVPTPSHSATTWEPGDLRHAIDAAPDMIFIVDDAPTTPGGPRIIYANRSMLREFGYTNADVLGRPSGFMFGRRTDPAAAKSFSAAVRTMLELDIELLTYRADGSSFWSDWRGHQFGDERSGKHWIASGRNTDRRRRAEDKLLMLSTALDVADDAIFVYGIRDEERMPRIRYVNPAALRQSGFSPAELEAGRRLDPSAVQDVVDEVVREMRAGRSLVKRTRLIRKDGTTYWANRSYQPIRDRKGGFSQWVCIERDISEIVEREQTRSDLMAMIGHDLRNPLTTILGFTDLLLEERLDDDPELDGLRQIRQSARRLESLAAEMLIVSSLERDEYHPRQERILLNLLLDDVLSYVPQSERIVVRAEADVSILADVAGIKHVIENLISNAAKFSDSKSPITVTISSLESAAMLRVTDLGIGIPADQLPSIFERTVRARNVGQRKGTGLGLSFAKRLVELNGGTIQAESVEGAGSTFEVTFPAA